MPYLARPSELLPKPGWRREAGGRVQRIPGISKELQGHWRAGLPVLTPVERLVVGTSQALNYTKPARQSLTDQRVGTLGGRICLHSPQEVFGNGLI
jgi:hypothetical protein